MAAKSVRGAEAPEEGDIVVRDGILGDETYGVYLVMSDGREYQLDARLKSKEIAQSRAVELLSESTDSTPTPADIKIRPRTSDEIEQYYARLSKDQLQDSLKAEISRRLALLSRSRLAQASLAYYFVFIVLVMAGILFTTRRSFTVPAWDMPLFGDQFAGRRVSYQLYARLLPPLLLILYLARYMKVRFTAAEFDSLRKQLLSLVLRFGWRLEDFAALFQAQVLAEGKAALDQLTGWMVRSDRWSFSSVARELRTSPSDSPGTSEKAPLAGEMAIWLEKSFERHVHDLVFIAHEPDWGSGGCMAFDPLIFLLVHNRVRYRVYRALASAGHPLDRLDAPIDPYRVDRLLTRAFPASAILTAVVVVGVSVWSTAILGFMPGWVALHLASAATVVTLRTYWNYRLLIGKRGFPRLEPFGEYTLGYAGTNKLLTI